MAQENLKPIEYSHKVTRWTTFPSQCKSCGYCIEKCPAKCLSADPENKNFLGTFTVKCQIEKCITCGTCEKVCPECAIRVDKNG